jgi:hypothetical protein
MYGMQNQMQNQMPNPQMMMPGGMNLANMQLTPQQQALLNDLMMQPNLMQNLGTDRSYRSMIQQQIMGNFYPAPPPMNTAHSTKNINI